MTQLQMKHWQDPVNALLGAWLVLSPWILGYQAETAAMANGVIVGLALVATALGAIFVPRAWEEWTEVALGVWMIASPWILGFSGIQLAMWSAVISGLVIVALALWVLATDKDYAGWWSDRVAH
jgi:hypothetical protein